MLEAPITIGTIVTFMFHSFFNSLARSRYLSFFHILWVLFCGQPEQQSRQFCKFSFFMLIIIRSGLLAEIRWSVCMSKSHMSLCVSFSRTGAGLCIYHLLVWSNLNLLLLLLLLLFYSLGVFPTKINWWFFVKVLVMVSFFRILADSNKIVICMVTGILLISISPNQFFNFILIINMFPSKCTSYTWYHRHPYVPYIFLVLWRDLSICLFLHFLWFSLFGPPRWQSPLFGRFSFLLNITQFGPLTGIRWCVYIFENFMRLILPDGFCVVHIPLIRIVKFHSLAQFPVDHLSHPVVSSLVL